MRGSGRSPPHRNVTTSSRRREGAGRAHAGTPHHRHCRRRHGGAPPRGRDRRSWPRSRSRSRRAPDAFRPGRRRRRRRPRDVARRPDRRVAGSGGHRDRLVVLPFAAALFVRWGRTRMAIHRRLTDVRVQPGTRVTASSTSRTTRRCRRPSSWCRTPCRRRLGTTRSPGRVGHPAAERPARQLHGAAQTRGRYRWDPSSRDVSDPFALTKQSLEFDERDELLGDPGGRGPVRPPPSAPVGPASEPPGRGTVPHRRGLLHDAGYQEGDDLGASTGRRWPAPGRAR